MTVPDQSPLSPWARALDALGLALLLIGFSVIVTGGFREFTPEERERFRPVRQRLVRTLPGTGRKSISLFASEEPPRAKPSDNERTSANKSRGSMSRVRNSATFRTCSGLRAAPI